MTPQVIRQAQQLTQLCLYPVQQLNGGCWIVTDSAGRKRYVVGYLDNGHPFCERVKHLE